MDAWKRLDEPTSRPRLRCDLPAWAKSMRRAIDALAGAAHTPGPWTVEQATDGRKKGYIRGPKGNGAGGSIAVARVSEAGNGPSDQAANARLIAAAPALLEALRQIREAVCSGLGTLPADDIERAEAAIRQAEGRQ